MRGRGFLPSVEPINKIERIARREGVGVDIVERLPKGIGDGGSTLGRCRRRGRRGEEIGLRRRDADLQGSALQFRELVARGGDDSVGTPARRATWIP